MKRIRDSDRSSKSASVANAVVRLLPRSSLLQSDHLLRQYSEILAPRALALVEFHFVLYVRRHCSGDMARAEVLHVCWHTKTFEDEGLIERRRWRFRRLGIDFGHLGFVFRLRRRSRGGLLRCWFGGRFADRRGAITRCRIARVRDRKLSRRHDTSRLSWTDHEVPAGCADPE